MCKCHCVPSLKLSLNAQYIYIYIYAVSKSPGDSKEPKWAKEDIFFSTSWKIGKSMWQPMHEATQGHHNLSLRGAVTSLGAKVKVWGQLLSLTSTWTNESQPHHCSILSAWEMVPWFVLLHIHSHSSSPRKANKNVISLSQATISRLAACCSCLVSHSMSSQKPREPWLGPFQERAQRLPWQKIPSSCHREFPHCRAKLQLMFCLYQFLRNAGTQAQY